MHFAPSLADSVPRTTTFAAVEIRAAPSPHFTAHSAASPVALANHLELNTDPEYHTSFIIINNIKKERAKHEHKNIAISLSSSPLPHCSSARYPRPPPTPNQARRNSRSKSSGTARQLQCFLRNIFPKFLLSLSSHHRGYHTPPDTPPIQYLLPTPLYWP